MALSVPPPVFAVYNKATETFQLIETEYADDGSVQRLKQWSRPDFQTWKQADEATRFALMIWMNGQEWYVIREPCEHSLQTAKIHDQDYTYAYTGYQLVWSNYRIHKGRATYTKSEWNNVPTIDVLEFQNHQVYPREGLEQIYARWSDVAPQDLTHHVSVMQNTFNGTEVDLESGELEDEARPERSRSWSDFSDIMDDEINERIFSRKAVKGCALMAVSSMLTIWVMATLFFVAGQ